MAKSIKLCCVVLFITVLLTEAYTGKRIKRHYELNEEKTDFEENASESDDIQNSKRTMFSHNNTNDHVILLVRNRNNHVKSTLKEKDANFVEKSKASINDSEQSSIKKNDTWVDFVINLSKLAKPYLPEHLSNLNLDWKQVEVALRSIEDLTISYEKGELRSNKSPIMATVRAFASAAEPMVLDYVRVGLGIVLDLIDNTAFMTTGHAISRRGLAENVIDDIMDAFTAILKHKKGDEDHYHNTEDL